MAFNSGYNQRLNPYGQPDSANTNPVAQPNSGAGNTGGVLSPSPTTSSFGDAADSWTPRPAHPNTGNGAGPNTPSPSPATPVIPSPAMPKVATPATPVRTMPKTETPASIVNPDPTTNALGYYQQWLPNLTQDQLNEYWTMGQNGQAPGMRLDDWYNSTFNPDGTRKAPSGVNAQPQTPIGSPGYDPLGGWDGSKPFDGPTQGNPAYGYSNGMGGYYNGAGTNGPVGTNGTAPTASPVAGSTTPAATAAGSPSASSTDPLAHLGTGQYPTPNIPLTTSVQFPGSTSTTPGASTGTTNTSVTGSTTPGATTVTPQNYSLPQLQSMLQQLMQPTFNLESQDLNRSMNANAAITGDVNSGGYAEDVGRAQADLAAKQGAQIANTLSTAQDSQQNRTLQQYLGELSNSTSKYQIDTNAAIAKMGDETTRLGIKTNDDLQRYLNDQNNALAKYGIDKNVVMEQYKAQMAAKGQSVAAGAQMNAAALEAATQQAIAQQNNAAALQRAQLDYNLGIQGLAGQNYRADQSNLLNYLALLMQANPPNVAPQVPGVVGYGG